MRTQGALYADTPHAGGLLVYGLDAISTYGNLTKTRNALGDYSLNMGASLTGQASVSLKDLKKLTTYPGLYGMPFQVGSQKPVSSSGIPGSSGVVASYPPPKGIRINDITVVSLITGAVLSAHTPSLNRTSFVNNVALSIVNVPLTGTLPTATQANPYVSVLTVTTPSFEVTDNADLVFDLTVTTGVGGAYRLYAVILHVDFNYN